MDFRAQKVDFEEADRRHAELARRRGAGEISAEEFQARSQELMVLDDDGRWWHKDPSSGAWNYHNGSEWVLGTPPTYGETATPATAQQDPPLHPAGPLHPAPYAAMPTTPVTQAEAPYPPAPHGATPGRRRGIWRWVLGLLAAVAILAFVGVAIVALLFFVSDSGTQSGQQQGAEPQEAQGGGAASEEGDASGEAAGGGSVAAVAFDAAFVHDATAENVSANSTYLDHPLLNGNPNAVVYVTQNWNPGGSGGKYNDHPIGVWYNGSRDRWAIFNQDREPMPEDASFNVAILAEAPGE